MANEKTKRNGQASGDDRQEMRGETGKQKPENTQPAASLANHDGALIACTSVLGALFIVGLIYQLMVNPSEVIPIVALAGALVVDVFVLVSSVMRKVSRDRAEKNRQYEDLYNAQKASYLVLRKSFDELTDRLEEMQSGGTIPAEEIINAQKALAKVTINRSKENADALMNSNDEMIKAFDSIEGMVNTSNDSLFEKQKALMDGVSKDIESQTKELTAQNKELDRKLSAVNEELRTLKHAINSLETAQRQQVAAQPVMMAFQAMPQMQGMQQVPVQPAPQPYVQQPVAPAPMPANDFDLSSDENNEDLFGTDEPAPSDTSDTEAAPDAVSDDFDLSADSGEDLFADEKIPDIDESAEEAPAEESSDEAAIPDEFDLSDSGDGLDLFADEKVPDVDESLTEEAPADELSLDEAPADELSLDDISTDDLSAEPSADELSLDGIATDDLSSEAPADDLSLDGGDELSLDDFPDLSIEETAADEAEAPEPEVVAEEPASLEPAPAPEPEPAPALDLSSSGVDLSDPNAKMSPDDIAALFAAAGNAAPAPAPEPEPAPAPEPEPTPAQDLSSSGVDLSDPNAKMSPDDIAALFAAAGNAAPALAPEPEPAPAPAPEPAPEPAPAPAEQKPIDLSGAGVDLSDPNKQLSPDEIAKLFASVQ